MSKTKRPNQNQSNEAPDRKGNSEAPASDDKRPAAEPPGPQRDSDAAASKATQEPQAIQEQVAGPGDRAGRYSFPTVSRCPRCGGTYTQAVSTQKNVQYRICRSAICRNRYTVIGAKITATKKPTI